MEWRSLQGDVLYQIPWDSQDTPDLHLKIRDAHHLEYPDLDPDFVTLGERHAISGGSHGAADPQEIELTWIFSAIGRALKRESPRDNEFLSDIAERAATFLEEGGPFWRLAHPKRRRRGKPTQRLWAMMVRPAQEEMDALVRVFIPEIAKTLGTRWEGIRAVEVYLRENHADALQDFSGNVIRRLIYLTGFSPENLPPELRGQVNENTSRERVYTSAFEGRVVNALASLMFSLSGSLQNEDLAGALQLDSKDTKSVRWILHEALVVLFGIEEARSMFGSFKIPLSRR
ncbi:MAG: hypothetical protein Q8S73_08700 [Deltaproteobacteria bacterium]|nr:hypothetical protein [Myxococcales bacterium]MDP3214170.1 hypothetical protein [Deltaproteobacteria bacterium]